MEFARQGRGNPHRQFERQLRCYSVAMAPTHQNTANVEFGGKIFLPPSALEDLAFLEISYPMMFRVTNTKTNKFTHCGVLEFNAQEGRCYLPHWMMQQLMLAEGDMINIKSASLPLGKFVKIQPQTADFLDVSNPRAILEREFSKFSCLTVDDIIPIKYLDKIFELKIIETRPGQSISIVETNIELDFAPYPGYVEPVRPSPSPVMPVPISPNQHLLQQPTNAKVEDPGIFRPFSGQGQRIRDRPTSATIPIQQNNGPTFESPSRPANMLSTSFTAGMPSTSPITSTFGRSPGSFNPINAAPINLPPGKMVFPTAQPPPPTTSAAQPTKSTGTPQQTTTGFKPFSGTGHSLK